MMSDDMRCPLFLSEIGEILSVEGLPLWVNHNFNDSLRYSSQYLYQIPRCHVAQGSLLPKGMNPYHNLIHCVTLG